MKATFVNCHATIIVQLHRTKQNKNIAQYKQRTNRLKGKSYLRTKFDSVYVVCTLFLYMAGYAYA